MSTQPLLPTVLSCTSKARYFSSKKIFIKSLNRPWEYSNLPGIWTPLSAFGNLSSIRKGDPSFSVTGTRSNSASGYPSCMTTQDSESLYRAVQAHANDGEAFHSEADVVVHLLNETPKCSRSRVFGDNNRTGDSQRRLNYNEDDSDGEKICSFVRLFRCLLCASLLEQPGRNTITG